MALKTCRECGREVSTRAGRCPGCGAPVSGGSGFLGNLIVLAILAAGGWYLYQHTSVLDQIKQWKTKSTVEPEATPAAAAGVHHRTDPGFPAGNYKFEKSTSILLRPDGTFRVESGDHPIWNCEGTWTFADEMLNMQSNPDESTKRSIPEFFYTPARLMSEEGSQVVWECNSKTHKWERREP
jgi:hypothetical protein